MVRNQKYLFSYMFSMVWAPKNWFYYMFSINVNIFTGNTLIFDQLQCPFWDQKTIQTWCKINPTSIQKLYSFFDRSVEQVSPDHAKNKICQTRRYDYACKLSTNQTQTNTASMLLCYFYKFYAAWYTDSWAAWTRCWDAEGVSRQIMLISTNLRCWRYVVLHSGKSFEADHSKQPLTSQNDDRGK